MYGFFVHNFLEEEERKKEEGEEEEGGEEKRKKKEEERKRRKKERDNEEEAEGKKKKERKTDRQFRFFVDKMHKYRKRPPEFVPFLNKQPELGRKVNCGFAIEKR